MALDLGQLAGAAAGATPYGAAAQLLSGAINTPTTATATQGPIAGAPVSVNVAGFGSKASGEARQALTQSGTPATSSSSFPATGGAPLDVPSWVLPAGLGLLALVLVLHVLKR